MLSNMYLNAIKGALASPDHHLRVVGNRRTLDQAIPYIAAAIESELDWVQVCSSTASDAVKQLKLHPLLTDADVPDSPISLIPIVQHLHKKGTGLALIVRDPENAEELLLTYQYPDLIDTGNVLLVTLTEHTYVPPARLEPLFWDAATFFAEGQK